MFLATSSTKVGVTNSLSQRPGVFLNVRGIAGQVQGLHIPRSGLQLFLRVRVRYCSYLFIFLLHLFIYLFIFNAWLIFNAEINLPD